MIKVQGHSVVTDLITKFKVDLEYDDIVVQYSNAIIANNLHLRYL